MEITRNITGLTLTADDWELFEGPDAEACAERLNRKFEQLVNEGRTRDEVERQMEDFMFQPENSKVGAADSEPMYHVRRLLKKVFAS